MTAASEICIIGPASPYRGGIANYTRQLAESFHELYSTTIINFTQLYPDLLFPGKTQYAPNPPELSVPNERVLSSTNPLSWFQTARYIKELAPRAIIFQWWHPFFGPAYRYIARHTQQENRRQIFLCHNVEPHESSFFDKRLLHYAYAPIHHFMVQSSLERTRLQQYKPQAEIKVHVHPVYSFFSDPDPALQPVNLPASEITLLYFGLVRQYKGLDILLEAMPLIREKIDAHLLIVGEFYDQKEPYLQQIQTLGIGDAVTIVDEYVPDEQVGWFFQQADVVVLPYRHATQSGIIPIAYNFTTPVIATRVGGLPDVVFEEETGYLVPPEDSTALANTVTKFARQRNQIDFQSHITEHLNMFSWESLRTTLLEMITT